MLLNSLQSHKKTFKNDSLKMRRAIRWSNYKPVTQSLKNSKDVIFIKRDLPKIALKEEKRIYQIIQAGVEEFNRKKESALNIVPPKMCSDFKRKLKNRFEKLDRNYDFAILDILKEKAEQQNHETNGDLKSDEKQSVNTNDVNDKSQEQLIGTAYLSFLVFSFC